MVDIQFIQTQTHSSYSHCIMMDCLSQAFSVIVVIEDTQQQQPTMISMSKKLRQTVKPYFSDHKLRRLRKKWLTAAKTSNEIKQLSMAYYRDKRAAKKQTHVTNNDISSTSRHQRKRKRVSSSTSE